MHVFLTGFLTSLGLIVAIGAQNAYVLKQGLKKRHVFPLVVICSLIDAVLMYAGVKGVGTLVAKSEIFLYAITIFGVIFLCFYGVMSLKSAFKNSSLEVEENSKNVSLKKAILTVLALSLLNPHVYLDTVLLIGSIGGAYESVKQNFFILGAISASIVWFFSLGYGARILIPLFKNPRTWQVLDFLIALVMFFIAFGLVLRLV